MTHEIKTPGGKTVLVICPEADKECTVCHKVDELRPYGFDGAEVCFDCAMATPESKAEAERRMSARIDAVTNVLPLH